MVLSHPYMEDYVVLPTRHGIRSENRLTARDLDHKKSRNDMSASRRCSATWINVLVEKSAWLSAGLIWPPGASHTGRQVEDSDSRSDEP